MNEIINALAGGSAQFVLAVAVVFVGYALYRRQKLADSRQEIFDKGQKEHHDELVVLIKSQTEAIQKQNDLAVTTNELLKKVSDVLPSCQCRFCASPQSQPKP